MQINLNIFLTRLKDFNDYRDFIVKRRGVIGECYRGEEVKAESPKLFCFKLFAFGFELIFLQRLVLQAVGRVNLG